MKLFSHSHQRFYFFAPLRTVYENGGEVQAHADAAFAELDGETRKTEKKEKSDTSNDGDMVGKAGKIEDQYKALKQAADKIQTKPDAAPLLPRLNDAQKRIDGAKGKVEGYKGEREVVKTKTLGDLKKGPSAEKMAATPAKPVDKPTNKVPLATATPGERPVEKPKVREYTEAEKAKIEVVAQQMAGKKWEIHLPDNISASNFALQRDGAVSRGRGEAVRDISKALGFNNDTVRAAVSGFQLLNTNVADDGKMTIVAGFRDVDSARATVKSVMNSHPSA